MGKVPKKCLTCKFMEFKGDECDVLVCTLEDVEVDDDYICSSYEVNKIVLDDAEQGCW